MKPLEDNVWETLPYAVAYVHNQVLLSHRKNEMYVEKMDETGDNHIKQKKPDMERQVSHLFSCVETEGGKKIT